MKIIDTSQCAAQKKAAVPAVLPVHACRAADTRTDLKKLALDCNHHLYGGVDEVGGEAADNRYARDTGVFPDESGGITGTRTCQLTGKDGRLLPPSTDSEAPLALSSGPSKLDWFPWIQELLCLAGLNHQVC